MKKLIFIMMATAISMSVMAQDDTGYFNKRNEVNIGYLNMLDLQSTSSFGVGYKRSLGEGALRIRVNYNYLKDENTWTDGSSEWSNYNLLPRLGYEFRLKFKRSMVMYGVDLCSSYQQQTSESVYDEGNRIMKSDEVNIGYGISPFLGYEFFINKHISISTETSFDFMYSKGTRENLNTNDGIESSGNESERETLTAKLSPLGIISINFHF